MSHINKINGYPYQTFLSVFIIFVDTTRVNNLFSGYAERHILKTRPWLLESRLFSTK